MFRSARNRVSRARVPRVPTWVCCSNPVFRTPFTVPVAVGVRIATAGKRRSPRVLAAPVERYRGRDGMLHGFTSAPGFAAGLFQLKVPLRGTVGVVNEHQTGIVLESGGLPL